MKRKAVGGDEQDALSGRAKNFYHWQPGERKKLKRKANKRERKEAKNAEKDG
jgi:hypothetical protein